MTLNKLSFRSLLFSMLLLGLALGARDLSAASARSQKTPAYEVLYTFTGGADGANPAARLLRDSAGNLYGTTLQGGNLSACSGLGCGVVFKLDPTGKETVLYTFLGGTDGASPNAGLVRDAAGNLYGTTTGGGDVSGCGGFGCGVVFKVDTTNKETVMYRFTGGLDGANPHSDLLLASGLLFGTTFGGGPSHDGVIFKLTVTGKESVLHSFTGGADSDPLAGLIRDSAGNFYGVGQDAVFEFHASGIESVLYTFTDGPDGGSPFGEVTRDPAGNLYGTTFYGGDLSCNAGIGCGVVYKLDPAGQETPLYRFAGGVAGALPAAGLVRDRAGNLYGTATSDGSAGYGVVFKVGPSGGETVLYTFTGLADGGKPNSALITDGVGNLYGTTFNGGGAGCGVIFRVAP